MRIGSVIDDLLQIYVIIGKLATDERTILLFKSVITKLLFLIFNLIYIYIF